MISHRLPRRGTTVSCAKRAAKHTIPRSRRRGGLHIRPWRTGDFQQVRTRSVGRGAHTPPNRAAGIARLTIIAARPGRICNAPLQAERAARRSVGADYISARTRCDLCRAPVNPGGCGPMWASAPTAPPDPGSRRMRRGGVFVCWGALACITAAALESAGPSWCGTGSPSGGPGGPEGAGADRRPAPSLRRCRTKTRTSCR